MHWFDVGTGIAFLFFGSVWSFVRGLTREILSLVGITAAFVLSFQAYPYAARHLASVVAHPWLLQVTGFVVICLSTTLLYGLIAILMHRLGTTARLTLLHRFGGWLPGLGKVVVVISALCIMTAQFFPTFAIRIAAESLLAPIFFRSADALSTLLPPDAVTQFHQVSARVRHYMPELPPLPPPSRSPPAPGMTPPQR